MKGFIPPTSGDNGVAPSTRPVAQSDKDLVPRLGLEPRSAASETVVLPIRRSGNMVSNHGLIPY